MSDLTCFILEYDYRCNKNVQVEFNTRGYGVTSLKWYKLLPFDRCRIMPVYATYTSFCSIRHSPRSGESNTVIFCTTRNI